MLRDVAELRDGGIAVVQWRRVAAKRSRGESATLATIVTAFHLPYLVVRLKWVVFSGRRKEEERVRFLHMHVAMLIRR